MMMQDVEFVVKYCDKCQRYSIVIQQLGEPLYATIPSWPFLRWGMDIVEKLLKATGQKEYIIMAMD